MVINATDADEILNVMDRRDFFRTGMQQAARLAVQLADETVVQRSRHWIRPPFARAELEFLLACTRCDKCIESCPHDVIFKLPARLGAQVVDTPALDILNKGCHLCDDWPCVNACEPKALQLPVPDEDTGLPLPKLAHAEINTSSCLPYLGPECGVCKSACPVAGAMTWDMEKPSINPELCTGCGLCREVCIVEPKAVNITSLYPESQALSSDNP